MVLVSLASFVCSFVRSFVRAFVRLFVRLLVCSFVCSFVRSSHAARIISLFLSYELLVLCLFVAEFWEDDRFESTYDTTLKYFEISKRLTLVNNRLTMIGELHQVLIEANQNHHAVILEWIIIILIVVEVLLDMLHLGFY